MIIRVKVLQDENQAPASVALLPPLLKIWGAFRLTLQLMVVASDVLHVQRATQRRSPPPSAWRISGQWTHFCVRMCVLNLLRGCCLVPPLLLGTHQQLSALVYRRKAKSTLSIVRCRMLIRCDATHRRGAISCICNFLVEKEIRIMSGQPTGFCCLFALSPPKLGIILKYHYFLWNCNDCLFLGKSVIKIVNLGFICICWNKGWYKINMFHESQGCCGLIQIHHDWFAGGINVLVWFALKLPIERASMLLAQLWDETELAYARRSSAYQSSCCCRRPMPHYLAVARGTATLGTHKTNWSNETAEGKRKQRQRLALPPSLRTSIHWRC